MRFFLLAALKGNTPAMANVGTLYETGATAWAGAARRRQAAPATITDLFLNRGHRVAETSQ